MTLLEPFDLSGTMLNNRVVMAPMTRGRSPDTVAGDLTALYYAQRAGAGLIVTEGTTISPQAQGSIMVPGIWSAEQVDGWSKTTRAVHDAGGRIFAQLWHVGRMSHSALQPDRAAPVGASAIAVRPDPMHKVFIYHEDGTPGPADPTPPRALEEHEIARVVEDFAQAADNALAAGFDGIEIHGATGYLFEQFLNPNTNTRDDAYGGSIEKRARFTLDVVDAIIARIDSAKVGIRLSPRSTIWDMEDYPQSDDTHRYLASELGGRSIAYIHLHDLGHLLNNGAPMISDNLLGDLKLAFGGPLMLAGGVTQVRASDLIARGLIDLAAFGQPYIANPDLASRFRNGQPLALPDRETYYGGDAKGYTDYPVAHSG